MKTLTFTIMLADQKNRSPGVSSVSQQKFLQLLMLFAATYMNLAAKHAIEVPTPLLVWNPCFSMRSNKLWHFLAIFFLHTIPAHVVDVFLYCIGKKPMLTTSIIYAINFLCEMFVGW